MPSYVPPKKNTQLIDYVALVSQASTLIFQANPTIASGDFKVSTDGGALANLGTLPTVTPSSSKLVKYTIATGEMNGDNVGVLASDAAGAEWCDNLQRYQTTAQQIDDLFATGAALVAGPIPGLGIVENGVAASVTATTLTTRTTGAAPTADQYKDRSLWIRGFGVVTIDANTAADPSVLTFSTPAGGAPTGTPSYIIGAQASQSVTNPPIAVAPTLSSKYGSLTDAQVRELIITRLSGQTSGLVLGVGNGSQKAPDGTAGTCTFTIDINGNVTAFSFTP